MNIQLKHCSFCGFPDHEVKDLFSGPTVHICLGCAELCLDIHKQDAEEFDEKVWKLRFCMYINEEMGKVARRVQQDLDVVACYIKVYGARRIDELRAWLKQQLLTAMQELNVYRTRLRMAQFAE